MFLFRRRKPVPCTLDAFCEMDSFDRKAYASLVCWPERCRCGEYGLPWPDLEGLHDEDTVHERARCQPLREAML